MGYRGRTAEVKPRLTCLFPRSFFILKRGKSYLQFQFIVDENILRT